MFTVEATDMVQAQNEFIAAFTGVNKARSSLNLAQIVDKRQRTLYDGKAVPLKEVQNARAALDAAENDMRSAEVALEAARNRLRDLGKTDEEIAEFQEKGTIDPATPIYRADRRNDRAAQGRSRAVHRHRRQRTGVRDRRSVDGLADRICPGAWSTCGPSRPTASLYCPGVPRNVRSRPTSRMWGRRWTLSRGA